MSNSDDFFEGKRPWSVIKDRVLESYMPPYLSKVNRLRKRIILIDGYAGPGLFDDGKSGSPLLMCQAAEKYAKGNYRAIFVNKDRAYHNRLVTNVGRTGYSQSTRLILGDSNEVLPNISDIIRDNTIFLYLDPFGLKGCDFNLLEKFLSRDRKLSTEIVLTMNMPAVHRLSGHNAMLKDNPSRLIIKNQETLTRVFGGNYWKAIMEKQVPPEEKEVQLIESYKTRLKTYLPYVGSCPVRQQADRHIKYFIVFISRHPDSMTLMNDIMINAYFSRMHEVAYQGTLFEESDWREMPENARRSTQALDQVILKTVSKHPGETREKIWERIIQDHFMHYLGSEYKAMVKRLVSENKLSSPAFAVTKRLNDECTLYPVR